jgi:7-keto-8-aminopelargonate synthetase-like enzyme
MLFTTAMTPAAAAASCEAIRILRSTPALVADLRDKVATFVDSLVEHQLRSRRSSRGTGTSAIVPLIVGASATARTAARELEADGIYVSCFSHPVVPEGKARLRMQISRAHSYDDLAYCAAACRKALRPA